MMNTASRDWPGTVPRRAALRAIGVGIAGVVLTACGGTRGSAPQPAVAGDATSDFSARFAGYEVAPEPNGDSAQVVWPAFVTQAGPDVQRLYAFQIENGDLMRYMPCFCGCNKEDGHRNNRDCYVKEVKPDGTVVLDNMAPT